jgi:glycosyltransferase involved in cell wall biosynthesis
MNSMESPASDLTIVIPAKNEVKLIPRLLNSLVSQDYSRMLNTKVLVADAGSTDGTAEAVMGFVDRLQVHVIPGGLPSVGRNAGAALARTAFVLFLDADVELCSDTLVRRAMQAAQEQGLHCVTTNILCRDGSLMDRLFYLVNDMFQYLSCIHHPFSTGMFMLFQKQRFDELGGFNELAAFAEDYLLSKQVARSRFRIVRGGVSTTNRRLQKMGHFPIARLFLTTALNSWNRRFFLRDHKYWQG